MAVPRFQVVRATRHVHLPVPREQGSDAGVNPPRVSGFVWRFMSANNRSLARSAQTCSDVESCLVAIRVLQEGQPNAVGEIFRNGSGQWVWRVCLDGQVVAVASRTYQRQVRARLMCDSFVELVAKTVASAPVQVIYR